MRDNPTAVLGIPIDNLTMEETVEKVFSMIERYSADKKPNLVCTVNTDFVVNTLRWSLQKAHHPELLDILRKADLVTADGMPLVWTSTLLGSPLKGRVTGADLVPELAREAAQRGKSVYLLGGRGEVAQRASRTLKTRYPGLNIAGCDSPFVHIEGELLIDALETDLPIVERINASGADILLIAFGNPKQELWFERNRHRLEVPVSIGIGGTFEFITGSIQRAPAWMQRTGLEWLFRLTQDPKRLWKRYLVDLVKFGILIWPSILYSNYRKQLIRCRRATQKRYEVEYKWIRHDKKEALVVNMPDIVNRDCASQLNGILEDGTGKDLPVIMDFSDVSFIDAHGFGLLLSLYSSGRNLYLTGLSPAVKRFFYLGRMSHLFSERIFAGMPDALTAARDETPGPLLLHEVIQDEQTSVIRFFGELTERQTARKDISEIIRAVNRPQCTVDLSYLRHIDSSGIIFILKLHRGLLADSCACSITGFSEDVAQMFRITKAVNLLHII